MKCTFYYVCGGPKWNLKCIFFKYAVGKIHIILSQNINALYFILFLCRIYFLSRLLFLHTLNLSVAIWSFHSVDTFATFDVQQSAVCCMSVCLWCLSAVSFTCHAQRLHSSLVTTTKPKERQNAGLLSSHFTLYKKVV
jgi:hypothetical protein